MGSLGKLRATILFSVAFASVLFCQKQSRVVGADVYLRAAAVASPKPVPTPQLTPVQWHEDLRFLSSQLERHHANAFHFISREAFIREVQELDSRLDRLNPDQIFVGMDRIESSVGDGHTYIRLPSDSPVYPVKFGYFDGHYRLLTAADSLQSPEATSGPTPDGGTHKTPRRQTQAEGESGKECCSATVGAEVPRVQLYERNNAEAPKRAQSSAPVPGKNPSPHSSNPRHQSRENGSRREPLPSGLAGLFWVLPNPDRAGPFQ